LQCGVCAKGTYSTSDGSLYCTACIAGINYVDIISSSNPCIPCSRCPAGKTLYSQCTTTNNTQCKACNAGMYSLGNLCMYCSVGYFSLSGSSACQICPVNTYSERVGSSTCTNCQQGSVAPAGSSTCGIECGNYQDAISGNILPCPVNTFCP
jgi:hypothetical protein